MGDEGRAPDVGAFHEAWPETQVLRYIQRPHGRIEVGGAQAVNVFEGESSVFQGIETRHGQEFQLTLPGCFTATGGAHTHDAHLSTQIEFKHGALLWVVCLQR